MSTTKSRPSILAWLVAAISLALLTVCAFLALIVSSWMLQERVFENLSSNLMQLDTASARGTLEKLSYANRVEKLVATSLFSVTNRLFNRNDKSLASNPPSPVLTSVLMDALESAKGRKWSEVIASLQSIADDGFSWRESQDSDGEVRLGTEPDSRIGTLLSEAANCAALQERAVVAATDFAESQERLASFIPQAELIRANLAELLSLSIEPELAIDKVEFYKSGFLQGLVVVAPSLEGVTDLVALRDELGKLGGKVALQGAGAHERFLAAIEELRAGSELVRVDYEEQLARQQSAFQERVTVDQLYRAAQRKLMKGISFMIIDLNSPQPSLSVSKLI